MIEERGTKIPHEKDEYTDPRSMGVKGPRLAREKENSARGFYRNMTILPRVTTRSSFFRLIFGERTPETASEAAVTRRLRWADGIPREERERNRDAESAFSMGRLGGDGLIGGGARVWRMGSVGTLRKDGRILWL